MTPGPAAPGPATGRAAGLHRVLDRIAEIRERLAALAPRPAAPFTAALAAASGAAPSAPPYAAEIAAAARRHGLDPRLLESVVRAESSFRPDAVSPKGAMGLMQIMPETAGLLGLDDPYDPEANLDAGARYLRSLIDRFGSEPLALAAYNAGPSAVERYGGVPPYPETRAYVERVLDGRTGTR